MSSVQGANSGSFNIRLKPRAERTLSADEILQRLPQESRRRGRRPDDPSRPTADQCRQRAQQQPIPIRLQRSDTDSLYRFSHRLLERKLGALPELQDVTSDLQIPATPR